jgi:hypothetical protein
MRPLCGLDTLGNEYPVTKCNILQKKPSTAPIQKPENLLEEIPLFCFYSEQKCATYLILVIYAVWISPHHKQ